MIQNNRNQKSIWGFTLIELMVVITIMAMLATVLILGIASKRASRDIVIAENLLVSNIRQAQSYTLASRNLPNGQSVEYYLLKFDFSKPSQFTLEAMYNVTSSPTLQDVATINLPADIQLASSTITQYSPSTIIQNISGSGACALLAFGTPFGKTFLNNGCVISQPPTIQTGDAYDKILTYVANSSSLTISTNSIMTITLVDTGHTVSKTVTINGITGAVSFN